MQNTLSAVQGLLGCPELECMEIRWMRLPR